MSKMGQELEKRLDENKYEMWEALIEIVNDDDGLSPELNKARQILAKIEGK